ncbi:MAG: pilus assembly protein [Roseibium sp.]|uniref:TadE/TadG family type IV pilus assembly protein n=1 Tax=Roseibium sp. TaxID=1936156 RepID=UPI00262784A9|nr:TadE/TadG family type IV pilus assembly protein [Roseibium sp.]MCV0425589.1 pilus assembly protein [Roseibium sp.]
MRWTKWQIRRPANRRKLWKDLSGATAIEFAAVGLPFFLLALATIEVGLAYFANRMVDNAVVTASRLIRTGQAADGAISQTEFKTQICNSMPDFMCDLDRINVEVTSVDSFLNADPTADLYDDDGEVRNPLGFDTGDANSIIVVNVVYEWPMLASTLGLDPGDAGNTRYLTSTMVFRNEPWS